LTHEWCRQKTLPRKRVRVRAFKEHSDAESSRELMMRLTATSFLALALFFLLDCGGAARNDQRGGVSSNASTQDQVAGAPQAGASNQAVVQNVSLKQADASQNAPVTTERKIIRNANLSLELDAPARGMTRVASIAESHGGFVVTSESRQQGGSNGVKPYETITMEVRVPAAQFDAAMGEIRALGSRVLTEKITGQDVTEEYIDLEARLRTQRALEAQFLEIMKGAREVSDALQVQRELANVRTEIERVEGRRRFLENQSSLSTISVTLQPPAPLISTTGFFHSLGSAFGDGVDIAATITLTLIRILLALVPVLLLVVLPLFLVVRFLARRARRRLPNATEAAQPRPVE
jgi:hypothetical protein